MKGVRGREEVEIKRGEREEEGRKLILNYSEWFLFWLFRIGILGVG